jgi:hypothetical protein
MRDPRAAGSRFALRGTHTAVRPSLRELGAAPGTWCSAGGPAAPHRAPETDDRMGRDSEAGIGEVRTWPTTDQQLAQPGQHATARRHVEGHGTLSPSCV